LAEAPVETQAVDRDGAKDGANLGGMIAFAMLPVAAMRTGTLRLQVRCELLSDDDRLQGFEDRFALGKREAQCGRGQVLPLYRGDVLCLGLALVGGDDDLNGILHDDVPSG
jgi:hypothetical protein